MPRFSLPVLVFASLAFAGCSFELTSTAEGASAGSTAVCRSSDMVCAGQVLAESRCARCHSVGAIGVSPYPGAQPFRVFWQRWTRSSLFGALKTGIIVEHDRSGVRLPEMKLGEEEIKQLFAYLDTIQEK